MKISHIQPPAPYRMRPMQLAFVASAVVVAISMLSFYVQLVHQSVERGEHLRYGQRAALTTPTPTSAKAVFASFGGDAAPSGARRGARNQRSEFSAVASSETTARE
jgi:hypothetical protein